VPIGGQTIRLRVSLYGLFRINSALLIILLDMRLGDITSVRDLGLLLCASRNTKGVFSMWRIFVLAVPMIWESYLGQWAWMLRGRLALRLMMWESVCLCGKEPSRFCAIVPSVLNWDFMRLFSSSPMNFAARSMVAYYAIVARNAESAFRIAHRAGRLGHTLVCVVDYYGGD